MLYRSACGRRSHNSSGAAANEMFGPPQQGNLTMRVKLLDVFTGVVATSALILAGMSFADRFGSQLPLLPTGDDRQVDQWDAVRSEGHTFGSPDAPVKMVVFGDYECAACGAFHHTLGAVLKVFPSEVEVTYRHMPLSYHRFAYPAARAAECAAVQGAFLEYHSVLFDHPTRMGSWKAAAEDAGVGDIESFEMCVEQIDKVPSIDRDLAVAQNIGVRATPGVIIDGVLLAAPPDSAALHQRIEDALAEGSSRTS